MPLNLLYTCRMTYIYSKGHNMQTGEPQERKVTSLLAVIQETDEVISVASPDSGDQIRAEDS